MNVYIAFEGQLSILHNACQHQTLALQYELEDFSEN